MKLINRSRMHTVYMLLAMLMCIVLFSGCTTAQKPLQEDMQNNKEGQVGILPEQLPNIGGQKLNTQNTGANSTDLERAQKIEVGLKNYQAVDNATVLVIGRQAIVGLKLNDNSQDAIRRLQSEMMSNTDSGQKNLLNNGKLGMNNERQNNSNQYNLMQNNKETQNLDVNSVISDKVKALDNSITDVLVTTDSNIIERINGFNNTIMTEYKNIENSIKR